MPALFAGIEGEEQLAVADDRIAAQPDSAAADHHPGLLRAPTPHDPVGIGQDQPLEQGFVVRRSRRMAGIARGLRGQPDQLIADPGHLAGRGRIDPAARKPVQNRADSASASQSSREKRSERPRSEVGRRLAAAGPPPISRTAMSFSESKAARAAPWRTSPSRPAAMSSRASRGWTGKSSICRPSGVIRLWSGSRAPRLVKSRRAASSRSGAGASNQANLPASRTPQE